MILRKAVRGITGIEFSVVLFLIGVFVAVLLLVLQMEQAAERSVFEWTTRNLKVALRLKVTHLMTVNSSNELNVLIGENPVLLLDDQSLNGYIGETDGAGNYPEGVWYFDRNRRELVYRFHQRTRWLFGEEGSAEGRLSIQARRHSPTVAGQQSKIEGVVLAIHVK
jgi:hypothetical protein